MDRLFERRLKFINMEREPGERLLDFARRINKLAELAELETITGEDLKLLKFYTTTNDELREKICELEDKSWVNMKDCIRKYEIAKRIKKCLLSLYYFGQHQ